MPHTVPSAQRSPSPLISSSARPAAVALAGADAGRREARLTLTDRDFTAFASALVAVFALVVDAKDEAAVAFYRHTGSTPMARSQGR